MKALKLKKTILSVFLVVAMLFGTVPLTAMAEEGKVQINETNFPDERFRDFVKKYDKDSDGAFDKTELDAVTSISLSLLNVSDLKGIEYFTALTELECYSNQLKTLDLSQNTALTKLECGNNQLESLDLSKNTALTELACRHNKLTALDLSKNTALTDLDCMSNSITKLDFSTIALTKLYCSGNQLKTLDLSKNTALRQLLCDDNKLETLDLSQNTALINLDCSRNPLKALDVSQNIALRQLWCYETRLTTLDLTNIPHLRNLVTSYARDTHSTYDSYNDSGWPGIVIDKILQIIIEGTHTVTFDMNGHGTAIAPQIVEDKKPVAKTIPNQYPTEYGWKFEGWYKEAACINKFDFDNTEITEDITLYAKWEKATDPNQGLCAVSFNMNGHGTAIDLQVVESGKTAVKPEDPTEPGWIFLGWYKEAECTNEFSFDTPITERTTLYAKWREVIPGQSYTVTFDLNLNGAHSNSKTPDPQTVVDGGKAEKPAGVPAADGLQFEGWYKETEGINEFNFDTLITSDITLYAKWTNVQVPEPDPDPEQPDPQHPAQPDQPTPGSDVPDIVSVYIPPIIEDKPTTPTDDGTKPADNTTANNDTIKDDETPLSDGVEEEDIVLDGDDYDEEDIDSNESIDDEDTPQSAVENTKLPKTGESGRLALWISLMSVAVLGILELLVYKKGNLK